SPTFWLKKQYPSVNGSVVGGAPPVVSVFFFVPRRRGQLKVPAPPSPHSLLAMSMRRVTIPRWMGSAASASGAAMLRRRMRRSTMERPSFFASGGQLEIDPRLVWLIAQAPPPPHFLAEGSQSEGGNSP